MTVLAAGLAVSLVIGHLFITSVTGYPAGYILRVVPHCGNGSVDGTIEIISDITVAATALCDNGLQIFSEVPDIAHCSIPISFASNGSAPCIMTKRAGAPVYTATIYIGWGAADSPIITNEEQFIVSCSFGDKGGKATVEKTAIRGLVAPKEMQNHIGPSISSAIRLEIIDVLGDPIVEDLPAGKKIQLQATTNAGEGEVGIRPASCDIIGVNTGIRYAVLRAGCGDGIIFEKDDGFRSTGLSSFSPYFNSFTVANDREIRFSCNFTVCNATCNGNSCSAERDKRDIQTRGMTESVHVHSPTYRVQQSSFTENKDRRILEHQTENELQSRTFYRDQHSSTQTVSWGITLLFSLFSLLCVISLSLSLYSYILVSRFR